MSLKPNLIKKLKEQTGVGILECRQALEKCGGDFEKAVEDLRKSGQKIIQKKTARETNQGLIEAYIHGEGRVGAMVELHCETDFVARNKEFKELAHDLAMQVAATNPLYLAPEDVPPEILKKEKEIYAASMKGKDKKILGNIMKGKLEKFYEEVCLLKQPFIKDDKISVEELINQKIVKLGENIKLSGFIRFSL
jgi:elongation factor Ts